MAKRTKKVGITGKYGTRYGASLRPAFRFPLVICSFASTCARQMSVRFTCAFRRQHAAVSIARCILPCDSCRFAFLHFLFQLSTSKAHPCRGSCLSLSITRLQEAALEEDHQALRDPAARALHVHLLRQGFVCPNFATYSLTER